MEEKIKVSLPKRVYDILMKDCEAFLFLKNKTELNKNLFINTLVSNFYETFSSNDEKFRDDVLMALDVVPNDYKEEAYLNLIKILDKRAQIETKSSTKILTFKPTKLSSKAIDFIVNVLVKDESISSYFRRLFSSYASKSENEREKILFKENYMLIKKSITKDCKVCISLKNDEIIKEASIYAIDSSKEELFNYVLLQVANGQNRTIRLAKIKDVSSLNVKREISNDNSLLFEKQLKYGIQYQVGSSENEPVRIKLTKRGQLLFKKLYLYRPICELIEDNIYTFNCSYAQIVQYFKRFGKDAIVISPNSVGKQLKDHYYSANKVYKKIAYDDNNLNS